MYLGSWPFEKKVAFTIRDDDVSYFTQPWMIDLLYSEAWRLGFKVSLAVIPNIKFSRSNAPLSFKGSKEFFPISENRELVDYLMKKIASGHVDIVQHGCTHARIDEKPEFAINDFKLVDERLKRGNRLLRETFRRNVSVFTAPHDKISRAAWKSVSQNRMCLCRKFTLGRLLATALPLDMKFRKLAKTIVHCPNPFKSIPDSIIDLTDMLVVQWNAFLAGEDVRAQLEIAKEEFLKRLSRKEAFVIAHHHWEYFDDWKSRTIRRDRLAHFNVFLKSIASKDVVWKTTLSGLCSWVKDSMWVNASVPSR